MKKSRGLCKSKKETVGLSSFKMDKVRSGAGFRKTLKNIVSHTKKHIKKLKPTCK